MLTFLLVLLEPVLVRSVVAQEVTTLNQGIYTKPQAKKGKALYEQHCISCHNKKYFAPVFKAWSGQTLDIFYMTMATTMPESNPGVLYDDEYTDVLAYILSLNRYPAGEQKLEPDVARLSGIVISE